MKLKVNLFKALDKWKQNLRKCNSGLAFHVAKLKVTLGKASALSDKLTNKKDNKTRPLQGFRYEISAEQHFIYTQFIL